MSFFTTRIFDVDKTNSIDNKDQSNLAKSGIATASEHNSSFVFAKWQHRTDGLAANCNCIFGLRFDHKSPLLWGSRTPSNRMCHWTQVYLPYILHFAIIKVNSQLKMSI